MTTARRESLPRTGTPGARDDANGFARSGGQRQLERPVVAELARLGVEDPPDGPQLIPGQDVLLVAVAPRLRHRAGATDREGRQRGLLEQVGLVDVAVQPEGDPALAGHLGESVDVAEAVRGDLDLAASPADGV